MLARTIPLVLLAAVTAADAAECPTGEGLLESPLFEAFSSWMDDTYPSPGQTDLRSELVVVGHGLGRAAAAAAGDARRATIVACLVVAIEQALAEHAGDEGIDAAEMERLVLAGWRGERDDEVAELTGVRDRAPAEDYFAGLLPFGPGGPPPARAPWSTRDAEPPTEPPAEPDPEPVIVVAGRQAGVRLRGDEYRLLEAADPSACHLACALDLRCSAYTFRPPAGERTLALCELRSGPGEAFADDCCISTIVRPPHPWAGLCAEDLEALGHAPVLVRREPGWSDLVVFDDPLAGDEIGIEACQLAPWDRAELERSHELVEVTDPGPDVDARLHRIETWRSPLGNLVEIGRYRR